MPLHLWVRYVSQSILERLGRPERMICSVEEGSFSARGLSHNMSLPAMELVASFKGDVNTGGPDSLAPMCPRCWCH